MKFSKLFILALAVIAGSFIISCDTTPPELPMNNQVVWLGDSIFALNGKTADYLEADMGEQYRHYYWSGADMVEDALGPLAPTIRVQFDQAFADDPNIRTIILDGGGNDVLISNSSLCSSEWRYYPGSTTEEAQEALDPGCVEFLDTVMDAFEDMTLEGYNRGVKHSLYMCVYYLNNASLEAVGKYGWDMAHVTVQKLNRQVNADNNRRIAFADPRDAFWGKDGLIGIDGIHPTEAGSRVLADILFQAMADNCIEQKSTSCVPVPVDNGL